MTGALAFEKTAISGEINQSIRQAFLSLYPNRHHRISRRIGSESWVTSKHGLLTDGKLLAAVELSDQTIWGCRWGATTRFAVLDVDKNSQYHNELGLARLRHSLASVGFAAKLYQSSASQGWHLYLFFDDWINSQTLHKALKQWLVAEGYTIKQGQLEVFPSNNGLRLPMQEGFAWLDDQGAVVVRREDKTTDQAIANFLDDLDAYSNSWNLIQSRINSRLNELSRKAEQALSKEAETNQDSTDDGFSAFFTKAGMIPEVYNFGQAYWKTGLTSPSQRHHAILCLGHYLWYGDDEAGVRALPGVGRADERARIIEAWLKERHNGMSEAVLKGDWNLIGADIRRACNWTQLEGSEQPQESYQVTDRAIDRLVRLTKDTGRVWSTADFKKGNIRREETAREKIRAALLQLIEEGRRISLRGLARLSGCDHKTISKHTDIWGIFRLSNVGGDLSLPQAAAEGFSLLPGGLCSDEKDLDRSDAPGIVPFFLFDVTCTNQSAVELSWNAFCAASFVERNSLRLKFGVPATTNSMATKHEVFTPAPLFSLAMGLSSGVKAGGISFVLVFCACFKGVEQQTRFSMGNSNFSESEEVRCCSQPRAP